MSNVIFIGDSHLKSVSPISRIDDFPSTILKKFEFIADSAKVYNCNTMIILGDLFDSPVTSLPYLAKVIDTFKNIADKGVTIYTIVGNHDIKNNRMDSLHSSALGILISTGYVKLAPDNFTIDDTLFQCFNYPDEVKKAMHTEKYTVCVAHRYFEFGLNSNDSFSREDIKRLNYNAMVLGHLHNPCDTEKIFNTTLYRPGSLSRNTSELYNKTRVPRFLLFNCINHKASYIDVQCEPAANVFVQQTALSNKSSFSMHDLVQFITASYSTSDMNIREYFNKYDIPYNCKERISKYLDAIGA